MAPKILPGDVVVAMPVHDREVTIGQVLLVEDPDHPEALLLHRLVARTPSGSLQLRGDANPRPMPGRWSRRTSAGSVCSGVPLVGFSLAACGSASTTSAGSPRRRSDSGAPSCSRPAWAAQADRGGRAVGHGRRRRRSVRAETCRSVVFVGALAAVLAVVIVVDDAARAAFTATAANTGTRLATATFPCLQRAPFAHTYLTYRFDDAPGTSAADDPGAVSPRHPHLGSLARPGTCRAGDSPSLLAAGCGGR